MAMNEDRGIFFWTLWLLATSVLLGLMLGSASAEITIGFLNGNANITIFEGNSDTVEDICIEVTPSESTNATIIEVLAMGITTKEDEDYKFDTQIINIEDDFFLEPHQCVNFTIIGDRILENNETITFVFRGIEDVQNVTAATAYVTIIDNDKVNVTLTSSEDVEENVGQTIVCATLSSAANTGRDITLQISTESGTAIGGEDYTELSPTMITFSTGSANGAQRCYNISIFDDSILEPDQYFSVVLATSDYSGVNIVNGIRQINIMDNDNVQILVPTAISVPEDAEVAILCINLSITSYTQRHVVILLNTENGAALANEDYGNVENGMIIFSNSSLNGTQLCYNISIYNDKTVESNETFLVLLSSTDVDATLLSNITVVTIVDDVDIVNISFPSSLNVLESVDQVSVCVILSSSTSTERALMVELRMENGTAISGEDYVDFLLVRLTFPTESTNGSQICHNIRIIDDSILEGDQSFSIVFSTSDSSVKLDKGMLQVNITDNDNVTVTMATIDSISENAGQVSVCVILSSISNTQREIILQTCTKNNSAIGGEDFEELLSTMISFSTGSANGAHRCYNISIIDDSILEPDQSFSVVLTSSDSGVVILNGSVQVNIMDDDVLNVSLAGVENVPENVDQVRVCAVLSSASTIERDIVLRLQTENGTAISGEDYMEIVPVELIFFTGSGKGNQICYNISIIDDSILEPDQYFIVLLNTSDSRVNLLNEFLKVDIVDDDEVEVSFPSMLSVAENADVATICVILSSDSTIQRQFMVLLNTEDVSATANEDYDRVENKRLVFINSSAGGTELCCNISINNDFTAESNETFLVILSSADSNVILQNNISLVTIIDGGEHDGSYGIKTPLNCPSSATREEITQDVLLTLMNRFKFQPLGQLPSYPAISCDEIRSVKSGLKPGNYWISVGENVTQTFCN